MESILSKKGASERALFNEIKDSGEMDKKVTTRLYDLKQMEEIAVGSPDFLAMLAKIYLDTIPDTSEEMLKATQSGEWDKASKFAHKLKSTIDSLNINSIKSEIRSIEMDGKNKVNTEYLKKLAIKVDEVIKEVASQIKIDFGF